MKKFHYTLLTLIFATGTALAALTPPPTTDILVDPELAAMFAEDGKTITTADFLALSPKSIREKTGERLGLQKSLALKAAQSAIRKQIKEEAKNGLDDASGGDRNQLVALILALTLGGLSIHNFYLGRTLKGIIQLLLLLTSVLIVPAIALAIWVLVDIIRIATGSLKPKNGVYDPEL